MQMGDDVLIVENPEDVSKHVPVNTSRIFISKLAETTDTSTIFIEVRAWPGHFETACVPFEQHQ